MNRNYFLRKKYYDQEDEQKLLSSKGKLFCENNRIDALEKAINECDGRALLAKINIDENQQIASQLRIQSIPTVLAFKNKKIAELKIKEITQLFEKIR